MPYKSRTTARFRKKFKTLMPGIKKIVREAYKLFLSNPSHTSLDFKPVNPAKTIYSARASIDVRVVGIKDGGEIVWFWLGFHNEYDRLIAELKKR